MSATEYVVVPTDLPKEALIGFSWRGGFTDANGRHAQAADVVEYRFGARRGILMCVFQDGDATVLFRDTRRPETVKFVHLCKVPEAGDP